MKLLSRVVTVGCLLALAGWASQAQQPGGRYNQQISSNVTRLLLSDKNYENVSAEVEDNIVKLTGTVVLDSTRRNLTGQVRHIPHVAGVDNHLVLSPPAPPDNLLYGHVMAQLRAAGYEGVIAEVHEGAVTLKGIVRTQQDWYWAKHIVSLTPGVKEVKARLSIASP